MSKISFQKIITITTISMISKENLFRKSKNFKFQIVIDFFISNNKNWQIHNS